MKQVYEQAEFTTSNEKLQKAEVTETRVQHPELHSFPVYGITLCLGVHHKQTHGMLWCGGAMGV